MEKFGILLTMLALARLAVSDQHKIVFKSLETAAAECVQYSIQDRCLARCQTLITRDWNDTVGMSPAYDRFFQPDPNDRCNNNRTQRCLQTQMATISPDKKCARASASVQCYLDHYGQVNTTAPKSVRYTDLQNAQIVSECGAMLGFSEERLLELVGDSEYLLQESRCLYRCFLIRSGLYNDSDGLNMERFYVLCGGYDDAFYESVAQCTVRVRDTLPCSDKCTLAQRLSTECIGTQYQATMTVSGVTQSNSGASKGNVLIAQVNNSTVSLNNTDMNNYQNYYDY